MDVLRSILRTAAASAALFTLSACHDLTSPATNGDVSTVNLQAKSKKLSIAITSGPETMLVGEAATFEATATDQRGRSVPASEISWKSLNPDLLVMNGNLATAVQPGTATIVATFSRVSATRTVTISAVPTGPIPFEWRGGAAVPSGANVSYAAHDAARREILLPSADGRVLVYRIATDTWDAIPVSGLPSQFGEYQIGYDAANDRILFHWRGLGSVYAVPRTGGTAVQLGNNANRSDTFDHVFGVNPVTNEAFTLFGYGFFAFRNTYWRFNAGNQWEVQPIGSPVPWPRQAPTASTATAQRTLYVFGGEGNASGNQGDAYRLLHSLWRFDFVSNIWSALIPDSEAPPASAPAGRGTAIGATASGGSVYLYLPERSPVGVPRETLWRIRPGIDAAFATVPTTGGAPTTTAGRWMFHDAASQDMVLVLGGTTVQVHRIRVPE